MSQALKGIETDSKRSLSHPNRQQKSVDDRRVEHDGKTFQNQHLSHSGDYCRLQQLILIIMTESSLHREVMQSLHKLVVQGKVLYLASCLNFLCTQHP